MSDVPEQSMTPAVESASEPIQRIVALFDMFHALPPKELAEALKKYTREDFVAILLRLERATLTQRYDALLAERDRIASDRDAKTARMWELGKECDALTQRVERLRRDVQIAVDLLMAFNKDAHRRNPLAVTAIDVFLAERALTHAVEKA